MIYMSIFCISRTITQNSFIYLIVVNFSKLNNLTSLCSDSSRCRDDINLEGHWRPWVCSLWASTAGEKLDQTVQTRLEELLMWKDSLYICSLPFFSNHRRIIWMPSSLSLDHWRTSSCVCWTSWDKLDKCIIFVLRLCDIHCVMSSQRSDRTLRRRTLMTPWRFIRSRYSVGLNHCFLIIVFYSLASGRSLFVIWSFFYALVSAAKSRDNDRKLPHRSGRNSPTQATPQKDDVSSAGDPGESEQARLDTQYYTDKIHLTTWGCSIQIKQKASTKIK